jgi:hypothetical protein
MSLTNHDLWQLRWFWEDKGDVTRYCRWDEIEAEVERTHPEITQAYRNLIAARRTLSAVLVAATNGLPEDES